MRIEKEKESFRIYENSEEKIYKKKRKNKKEKTYKIIYKQN